MHGALRYCDGNQWTEHVSDNGQQGVDHIGWYHTQTVAVLTPLLNLEEDDPKIQRERIKIAQEKLRLIKERARGYKAEVSADFTERSQQQTQARSTRAIAMGQRRSGMLGALNTAGRITQGSARADLQQERAAFDADYRGLTNRIDEAVVVLKEQDLSLRQA